MEYVQQKWADEFEGFVRRYGAESKQPVASERFSDGMDFISDYRGGFDLILMDIAMPHMNGLEAARRLRERMKTYASSLSQRLRSAP